MCVYNCFDLVFNEGRGGEGPLYCIVVVRGIYVYGLEKERERLDFYNYCLAYLEHCGYHSCRHSFKIFE